MSPALHKGLRLFSLLIVAIGLIFLVAGAWKLREDLSSQSWPSVDGRISLSEISTVMRKKKNDHRVKLSYDYQVRGMAYRGERIGSAGSRYKSRAEAEKVLTSYPAGKTVLVHYDPDRPEISRLETGVTGKTIGNVCIGLFLALGGGTFALLMPKIFR